MAIKELSDLVLDVAKAADPVQYRASVQKLRDAQLIHAVDKNGGNESNFSTFLDADGRSLYSSFNENVKVPSYQSAQGNISSATATTTAAVRKISAKSQDMTAYKKFEAFMLQSFIENMFPKNTESVFGKGQAGEIWKSMMAEAMGKQMAEAGGIGIATMLAKNKKLKDEQATIQENLKMLPVTDNKNAIVSQIVGHSQVGMLRNYKKNFEV